MQKKIIVIIVLILGCNYKPKSEGLINEIIVVASDEDRMLLTPYIEDVFYDPIYTPQEEHLFKLKWIQPWELNDYKKYHNVILLSLKFPSDSTGDELLDKYLKASNTTEKIFLRENIYSNDQIFLSIKAFDIIDFKKIVDDNYKWINSTMMEKYNEKNIQYIYSKGLNDELISYIAEYYKIKIDIQKDYIKIRESENKKFIWLGRGYPYRWIVLFKTQKINDFWQEYEKLIDLYMPEVLINENFRSMSDVNINNRKIKIYRGIYDYPESETGGPFFVYEINNKKNDEKFLLSGYVNYPGHRKVNLIKGIEVLFNSYEILD